MNGFFAVARTKLAVGVVAVVTLLGTGGFAVAAPAVRSASVPEQHPILTIYPQQFFSVAPVRVLDTRGPTPIGIAAPRPLGPGQELDLPLTSSAPNRTFSLPAGSVSALLNVTIDSDATEPSFLTVWPQGASRPLASANNATPGLVTPNLISVTLGETGAVSFFNQAGSVNLIVDLVGFTTYMTPSWATLPQYIYRTSAIGSASPIPLQTTPTVVVGPVQGSQAGAFALTLSLELITPEAAPGNPFRIDCQLRDGSGAMVDDFGQPVETAYANPATGAAIAPIALTAEVEVTYQSDVTASCTVTAGAPLVPGTPPEAANVRLLMTKTGVNLAGTG